MKVGVYIHPHDLADDPGRVLDELHSLGVREIALAASYHAGRWTSARGAAFVRFLEDGVTHLRVERSPGALPTIAASNVLAAGEDIFDRTIAAAADRGIAVHAWTVCHHNSPLGRAHPDCVLENALGERMTYALCPAHDAVRRRTLDLAAALAGKPGLAGIELEAAGYLGYVHASHHEKSSHRLSRSDAYLLSLCFCAACIRAMEAMDTDVVPARQAIVRRLRERLAETDVLDSGGERPADIPGIASISAARARIVGSLLEEVRATVRSRTGLAVMISPDPIATGAAIGTEPAALDRMVDRFVVNTYGEDAAARRETLEELVRAGAKKPIALGIWPKRPEFESIADVRAFAREAAAIGIGTVRLYHYDLLPRPTLERAVRAILETS